jgi:hypothetical protein
MIEAIKRKRGEKGIVWSEITWWIIGLAVLALITIALFLAKAKGISLIEQLNSFIRFGR